MASATEQTTALETQAINAIRTLSMDAVQAANSGHPGLPMGAAPMAYVLWQEFLKHNPRDPQWPDRDRFVLSAGHGSALIYSLLHLTGYDLSLDDLKAFRQLGSKTPGHPERGHTPGVEVTTGPLGQGFANGVGFAIAEQFLAATYNRPGHEIVDHYTYGIVSDGDMMEGVAFEAASIAAQPQARQADLPLRPEPHHPRRLRQRLVPRGCAGPLRGARLARALDRRHGHRPGPPGPRGCAGPKPNARP